MSSRRRIARAVPAAFTLSTLLVAAPAAAAPAIAPAGGGQPSLAVGFDAKGELRAALCRAANCTVEGGLALGLPRELAAGRARSKLSVVGIGAGRRAVWVSVPTELPTKQWEAVVAAPLAGAAPLVLFAGLTGYAQGEDGLRRGGMVVISEPDASGARSILIGQQREDVTLCGRPTILAPEVLEAKSLTLRPAKVQRLSGAERNAAPRVIAERATASEPAAPQLLRATTASSAVGDPAALTDGNAETTWAEGRGGDGRGEFIVMNAPPELPIVAVEFAVRPPGAAPARGAAPRELWLATTKHLFHVTLPDDGWKAAGSRYVARLPAPIQDDCLAVAFETSFDASATADVTLAEVTVKSPLAGADLPALLAALATGDARAQSAQAVLRALGQPAFDALAAKYASFDGNGRRLALEVLDAAPCKTSASAYVDALTSPLEGLRAHADARLPRCAGDAAPVIAERLRSAKGKELSTLADTLASIAPEAAVGAFVPLFEERAVARRRLLRAALGRASRLERAAPALRAVLADPATPEVALLEVLRAVGPRAAALAPESSAALARLGANDAAFRTRYLRLEPAGVLAPRIPAARALLGRALTADPDPRVRAAAARAVVDAKSFQAELIRGLGDSEVRVRAESARALAGAPDGAAVPALLERLDDDRWPLVRALSAAALAGARPDPKIDERLAAALDDDGFVVRREALGALGARRALAYSDRIIERLDDEEERFDVRVAAARALGVACDAGAVGALARHAKKLADPYASMELRAIAVASLGALRDIGPRDLKDRISALYAKDAPPIARIAAESALRSETARRCRR